MDGGKRVIEGYLGKGGVVGMGIRILRGFKDRFFCVISFFGN